MIDNASFLNTRQSFPHFYHFNKAYLVSYFSLYKIKLVDPWVRQKREKHVLQILIVMYVSELCR